MRNLFKLKNKSGFSIMEMILAMGLLTIISLLFVSLMLFAYNMANNASNRSGDSFISSGGIAEKYTGTLTIDPDKSSEIEITYTDGINNFDLVIDGMIIEQEVGSQKYSAFVNN